MTEAEIIQLPQERGAPGLRSRHHLVALPSEEAGIYVAKVEDECLLDRIYMAGKLKRVEEPGNDSAKRRHDAGILLREQWHVAGLLTQGVGSYGIKVSLSPETADMMPEHQAYARRRCMGAYRELRKFGPYAGEICEVCIFDYWPQWGRWGMLRRMLDALADYQDAHHWRDIRDI